MSETVHIPVNVLDLGRLGDGEAAEQFAAHIREFLEKVREQYDTMQSGGTYQVADGCLKASVVVAVDIVYSLDNGRAEVVWRTDAKQPKRKGNRQAVLVRDNELLVEHDDKQLPLVQQPRPTGV